MEDVINAFDCRMGAPESWRSAVSLIRNPSGSKCFSVVIAGVQG
jgi:hypothetical protein